MKVRIQCGMRAHAAGRLRRSGAPETYITRGDLRRLVRRGCGDRLTAAAGPPVRPIRYAAWAEEHASLSPHLLYVSGEDHHLRIPFMLAMRERGFRITAAGTGDPAPFARAGLDYCPFRFNRFVNPLADLAAIKTLSRLVADVRPDLVQSFDTKPNLLVPLAARGIPDVLVVRTINGMGWLYSSGSLRALALRAVYIALHQLAARSTAATVFQNHEDQEFFERHRTLGRGLSLLIPGSGVDIERFERDQATGSSPARLREALGLGASEVVVTVTRLTRQKGIPTLLEAAALVHKVRPGVRFLLVGPRGSEGDFAVSKEEIDRHAPYVMALGQRSDVPSLLALANVFAFPTEYREGVPRALLEAALAGLPIVTTRMPGCTDVVRHGWSGFLVPPHAPGILAARIIDLLREQAAGRAMGRRAAKLVRQEFGLALTATRYAGLYAELLGWRPDLGPLQTCKGENEDVCAATMMNGASAIGTSERG
jgi:glycosyltransferase involved in cell wall biosynthesis